jgi:C1A family cysteine protease
MTTIATERRTERDGEGFDRVLNIVPSKGTDTDWQFTTAMAAGEIAPAAALPPAHDLREAWWTIGDQEDTGSCVGWATGDGVMRYTLVKAGRIGSNERISPRFIWMSSKETDEFSSFPGTFIERGGTSLKAAMEVCRKYGVVTEELLPFHIATKMYTGDEQAFWAAAAQRRIRYYNLDKSLDRWKEWLVKSGPILVALQVDSEWMGATANGGIVDTYRGDPRGGHAVTVVGYRADGRFVVRNSWGTDWGDKGFAYVSPKYIADAFFTESYGVQL